MRRRLRPAGVWHAYLSPPASTASPRHDQRGQRAGPSSGVIPTAGNGGEEDHRGRGEDGGCYRAPIAPYENTTMTAPIGTSSRWPQTCMCGREDDRGWRTADQVRVTNTGAVRRPDMTNIGRGCSLSPINQPGVSRQNKIRSCSSTNADTDIKPSPRRLFPAFGI